MLAALALVVFRQPLLRAAAYALIVEDPLEPAGAIVVLTGGEPFRDLEAAALYRAGWAPKVVVTRETESARDRGLRQLGITVPNNADIGRQVLLLQGVPEDAIVTPPRTALNTVEELQGAYALLAAEGKPIIFVTTRIHTRRVGVVWHQISGGTPKGIVRYARSDPFDPESWWRTRDGLIALPREYQTLANQLFGTPARPRQ